MRGFIVAKKVTPKRKNKPGAGRPPGEYGPYVEEHLRRVGLNLTIPAWIKERVDKLAKKKFSGNRSAAFEDLILKATNWREPKK